MTPVPPFDGLVPEPVSLTLRPTRTGPEAPPLWKDLVIDSGRVDPAKLGLPEGLQEWQLEEAHRIEISSGRALISASTALGEWRARRRLAVLSACADPDSPVADLVLVDFPKYRHRGLHLDIVRHYFGPSTILRVMDLMADLALNVLHLHLTDDQAWRIDIPSLPELVRESGEGAVGGVEAAERGGGLARGWLGLDELAALSARAEELGIALVPEVDLPGHTNAALHAMPGLNPDGRTPPAYTGAEVGFSSLSTGAPDTERFLTEVVSALAPLSAHGFHIGGDECFSTERSEYEALVTRALGLVHGKGLRVSAWQEAAPLMGEGDLVQVWDPRLSSTDVAEAAKRGARIVLSPADRVYLDMKQAEGERIGLDWMGVVPARQTLEWDPEQVVPGAPAEAIEGVEACLWTETLLTEGDLGQMLLPRLAAVAEVAWCGSGVGRWESFAARAAALERLWRSRGWTPAPLTGV